MHIEKNVCDSIGGTLLNIKGKSKDGLHSRMDLKELKIRKDLHPDVHKKSIFLPLAPHTLSKVVEVKVCVKFIDDNLDMLAIIFGNIIINNFFLSLGNV